MLTEKVDGHIHVTVPRLPELVVEVDPRTEALEKTRKSIITIVSQSEIIQLDVPTEPKSGNHYVDVPWEWFGRFEDNPTWVEKISWVQFI